MFYNLPSGVSNLTYGIAAIVLLVILFFFLFLINVYVLERVSRLIYKNRIKNEAATHENAVQLLEDARRQAFEIIKDANTKAQDILNRSGVVGSEANDALKKEIEELHSKHIGFLEGLSNDTITAYKKVTEDEKNKGVAAIGETVSDVESVTSEAISALKTEIDTQRKSYEEFFGENMKKEMDAVRSELKDYKEKKIQDINDAVKVVLKDVCKDVLGQSLPVEDQEDLILKSLDEAKTMGVFGDE